MLNSVDILILISVTLNPAANKHQATVRTHWPTANDFLMTSCERFDPKNKKLCHCFVYVSMPQYVETRTTWQILIDGIHNKIKLYNTLHQCCTCNTLQHSDTCHPYMSILPQAWHPAEGVVGTDGIQTGLQKSCVTVGRGVYKEEATLMNMIGERLWDKHEPHCEADQCKTV